MFPPAPKSVRKADAAHPVIEGCVGWTGDPGSGKTYGAVESAYIAKQLGWLVATNDREVRFQDHHFRTLEELSEIVFARREEDRLLVRPMFVVLDEAHFFANSRKWEKLDQGFFTILQQVRKFGIVLHYTTIDYMQVDVQVRRLTRFVWECERRRSYLLRYLMPPRHEQAVLAEREVLKKVKVKIPADVSLLYDSHNVLRNLDSPEGGET